MSIGHAYEHGEIIGSAGKAEIDTHVELDVFGQAVGDTGIEQGLVGGSELIRGDADVFDVAVDFFAEQVVAEGGRMDECGSVAVVVLIADEIKFCHCGQIESHREFVDREGQDQAAFDVVIAQAA